MAIVRWWRQHPRLSFLMVGREVSWARWFRHGPKPPRFSSALRPSASFPVLCSRSTHPGTAALLLRGNPEPAHEKEEFVSVSSTGKRQVTNQKRYFNPTIGGGWAVVTRGSWKPLGDLAGISEQAATPRRAPAAAGFLTCFVADDPKMAICFAFL